MEDERIIQRNADGSTVTIPKQFYEACVQIGDRVSRTIALLGLVLGGAGAVSGGVALYRSLQEPTGIVQGVDPQLAKDLETNLLGDCLNENKLRQIYGAKQLTLDECQEEREGWAEKLTEIRRTPTPTPTP